MFAVHLFYRGTGRLGIRINAYLRDMTLRSPVFVSAGKKWGQNSSYPP